MPPRIMSPIRREMDQLEASQREGDSEPQESGVTGIITGDAILLDCGGDRDASWIDATCT